ncbi:hypothetical protein NDU88_001160 [Pleurodeles waltl]|uniref:Uncharacterized protein n=1 Tax=Pleurodeles waltl TaxID=8319 RepID=A0AAV7U9K3_PLEWA|nr:hypothetical protein NDU88_001160 [Pleurodeles waltl]
MVDMGGSWSPAFQVERSAKCMVRCVKVPGAYDVLKGHHGALLVQLPQLIHSRFSPGAALCCCAAEVGRVWRSRPLPVYDSAPACTGHNHLACFLARAGKWIGFRYVAEYRRNRR